MSTDYRVVYNRFPDIERQLNHSLSRVIRKATFDVQAYAVTDAPVDTGNLRNSIQPLIIGPYHGRVTVGAEYGMYVNYGTYKMAARPFFTNAVERIFVGLPDAIARAMGGVR